MGKFDPHTEYVDQAARAVLKLAAYYRDSLHEDHQGERLGDRQGALAKALSDCFIFVHMALEAYSEAGEFEFVVNVAKEHAERQLAAMRMSASKKGGVQ